MAKNQDESDFDDMESFKEKVNLEDLVLPKKQEEKVDAQLFIEFTEIKQEPLDQIEDSPIPNPDIENKCISCDDNSISNFDQFRGKYFSEVKSLPRKQNM